MSASPAHIARIVTMRRIRSAESRRANLARHGIRTPLTRAELAAITVRAELTRLASQG